MNRRHYLELLTGLLNEISRIEAENNAIALWLPVSVFATGKLKSEAEEEIITNNEILNILKEQFDSELSKIEKFNPKQN